MKNYTARFWKPAIVRSGEVGFTALSTSRSGLFIFIGLLVWIAMGLLWFGGLFAELPGYIPSFY